MTIYIVWNEARTEGYATTDAQVAYEARKGADSNCYTAEGEQMKLAQAFCELTGEESCTIQLIEPGDDLIDKAWAKIRLNAELPLVSAVHTVLHDPKLAGEITEAGRMALKIGLSSEYGKLGAPAFDTDALFGQIDHQAYVDFLTPSPEVLAVQAALDAAKSVLGETKVIVVEEEAFSGPCPDCGTELVSPPGGGVKCPKPGCGYWFCY